MDILYKKRPKKPIYFGFVYFTAFKSQLHKNKFYKNVVEGLKSSEHGVESRTITDFTRHP